MGLRSITNSLLVILIMVILSACNIPLNGTGTEIAGNSIETILTEMAIGTTDASDASAANLALTSEPDQETIDISETAKVLNVCLGREPESLFIYNSSSRSMWSVLESVYDGPFDFINGEELPVIFENIQVENETVPISEGNLIANSRGELDSLAAGVELIPADGVPVCGSDSCSYVWDGTTPLEMIQTKITFTIKSEIAWSDGNPLLSTDSVFSWKVNSDPAVKTSKKFVNMTESYTALDDHRVKWVGIPGFIPQNRSDVFWFPLPEHLLSGMKTTEILADELVNRSPIGWGAYKIAEWIPGEKIVMTRNETYSGNTGNVPYFDNIIYKFYGTAGDNSLAALKNGTCDVVDSTVDLSVDLEPILEDVRDGKLSVYVQPQSSWEQITLNLDPIDSEKTNFFSDVNIRKAIAQCINREKLIRDVFYGQTEVPYGFYPNGNLLSVPDAVALNYDQQAAADLLEAAGWTDLDGDPMTPRIAKGITGIPDGTEFSVSLKASDSSVRQKAAKFVIDSLQTCGIGVSLTTETLDAFYAQGPDGSLFGRKFDMALFAWSGAEQFPCSLYSSAQIPDEENRWIGMNIGGYQSEEYDRACNAALRSSLLSPESRENQALVQSIYAGDLPVIPLYFNFTIAASDSNICGLKNAAGTRSFLWNIESLSSSDTPCAVSQWQNIYSDSE